MRWWSACCSADLLTDIPKSQRGCCLHICAVTRMHTLIKNWWEGLARQLNGQRARCQAWQPGSVPGATWWNDQNNSRWECAFTCVCVRASYACLAYICCGARRGCPAPWNLSYSCEPPCEYWEPNSCCQNSKWSFNHWPFLQTSDSIWRLVLTTVAQSYLKLFIFQPQSSKYWINNRQAGMIFAEGRTFKSITKDFNSLLYFFSYQ